MSMLSRAIKHLRDNPWYLPLRVAQLLPWFVPDWLYVRLQYKYVLKRWPDLKNPTRYTEKLQWLKLHDHNSLYTMLVDKLMVKDYIAKTLGPEYVFKTLGAWKHVRDIDYASLPDQFVLKCNHFGGGAVFICKDKKTFDFKGACRKLEVQLKTSVYFATREWPYKNVRRRVFAEAFMQDEYGDLRDYKVYCFNGVPKFMLVASNRFTAHNFNLFYMDGSPMPIVSRAGLPNQNLVLDKNILAELSRLSALLSKGMPHVRMDFYVIDGQVFFGEFTFFDASGLDNYDSDEFDLKLGSLLSLPR